MGFLEPPPNFAMVAPGVYRSAFPSVRNLPFLAHLKLRAILCLCPETYPHNNQTFLAKAHIELMQFGVEGNKEPADEIPHHIVVDALRAILDQTNRPLLIHCNMGKHRTGCFVGCLRRVQNWSLVSILDEYRLYTGDKARLPDELFIECFSVPRDLAQLEFESGGTTSNPIHIRSNTCSGGTTSDEIHIPLECAYIGEHGCGVPQ